MYLSLFHSILSVSRFDFSFHTCIYPLFQYYMHPLYYCRPGVSCRKPFNSGTLLIINSGRKFYDNAVIKKAPNNTESFWENFPKNIEVVKYIAELNSTKKLKRFFNVSMKTECIFLGCSAWLTACTNKNN